MESSVHQRERVKLRSKLRPAAEVRHFTFESDFFSAPCGEVMVDGIPVRIVESGRMPVKRLQSIFAKEPTTIPWLETFTADDVFVDIGANIGIYSIYAAKVTGCRTFSLEPESLNFAELNKNIFVNDLSDKVTAFCCAVSDETKVGLLHLGAFGYSYSHHDFNENTWTEDKFFGAKSTPMDKRIKQGVAAFTLDDLVASGEVAQPNHIKVDVDGLEHRVFAGMQKTLQNPEVQTLLLEIDFQNPKAGWMIDSMLEAGWKISMDQLRTNRKLIFTEEQIQAMRRSGRGGLNYIFYRDDAYGDVFADFLDGFVPPVP